MHAGCHRSRAVAQALPQAFSAHSRAEPPYVVHELR